RQRPEAHGDDFFRRISGAGSGRAAGNVRQYALQQRQTVSFSTDQKGPAGGTISMHSISSSAIILDTVVKSTLLLAIASVAALALKRRSAATQHMVRTFALAALLLLPILVMLTPAWHIKGF